MKPDKAKRTGGLPDVRDYKKPYPTAWTRPRPGITAIGAGLPPGLFTRLWCVAGIGFLVMTYLAAPPWPWLPPPSAERRAAAVHQQEPDRGRCPAGGAVPPNLVAGSAWTVVVDYFWHKTFGKRVAQPTV